MLRRWSPRMAPAAWSCAGAAMTEALQRMIERTRLEYDPAVADELQRLVSILNTPVVEPFVEAAVHEARHQVFRWGEEHDATKTAWDWFWTLGYLGGKAAHAA